MSYSDAKVANRNVRDFGWEIAHPAVSRRPPISLYTSVAHTHMYTRDANVWDSSIVQAPFSVAPCQTLIVRFATFASLIRPHLVEVQADGGVVLVRHAPGQHQPGDGHGLREQQVARAQRERATAHG
jgi:hypothetical protein